MKRMLFLAAAMCLWVGTLCAVTQVQPPNAAGGQTAGSPPATIDYQQQVHTILAAECLSCHSAERRSGGLSLGAYADVLDGGRSGAAIRPGDSAGSLLVRRITGETPPQMPLGRSALSAGEVAAIRAWIDEGARETITSAAAKPKWEAPLALERPAVHAVRWRDWTTPVDRFAATYLGDHDSPEPELIGDAAFARRAYLDIWGLLPPPADLQSFAADKSSNKRAALVGRLLADNGKYAEHWISFWNDLLRNEEGVNYYSETATRKSITPWLLNALQTNKPYNQWISQLLNPTDANDPDGFLIGVNWRGSVSASQTPAMQASQNTSQAFLGINFKCNSCHDSFINRWKLKDAYALAAYFSAEEKLQLFRCDVAQAGQFATASYMYPELNRPLPSSSSADRRATVAAIFTDPFNGRVPRTVVNRIWAKLMGRGIVANVDDMDGEPWSPELLDWIASDFVANGYDLKRLIATIMASRSYQLPAVARTDAAPKDYSFRGPELRRLTAEEFADAIASVTGDWHVAPGRANGIAGEAGGGAGRSGGAAGRAGSGVAVFSGAPVEAAGVNQGGQDGGRGADGGRGGQPAAAPAPIQGGTYAREWRIAGNSLTRALGRPIRDQVFSARDTQATTIQALELINGETLTHWLSRGARKMLGELPPEPRSLFSRQVSGNRGRGGGGPAPFNVDVSTAQKLYLIVEDNLSTAPDKATPLWLNASFTGPNGKTLLASLTPMNTLALRDNPSPIVPLGGAEPVADVLRVKFPSVLVYDIAGKGFTRFEGVPTMENVQLTTGENVAARFFLFDQQPSMDRLAVPSPETPLPALPVLKTIPETVDRVYWYLLGRAPSAVERRIALAALADPSRPGHPNSEGLADLLWSILMSPEFQLIR